MRPTRSALATWKPGLWKSLGASLVEMGNAMRNRTANYLRSTRDVEEHWSGTGHDGAEVRAEDDTLEISRIADKLDEAGEALVTGGQYIWDAKLILETRVRDLESDEFSVSDDWAVIDLREYGEIGDDAERVRRYEHAQNEQVFLRSYADAAGSDDEIYGNKMNAALAEIDMVIPPSASLSGQQAAIDLEAFSHGSATQSQRDRLNAATQLSPEKLSRLASGLDIDVSYGQLTYLKHLVSGIGAAEGVSGFANFSKQDRGLRRNLANGLYILSNPNVTSGGTSRNSEPALRGGIEHLPPSLTGPLLDLPVSLNNLSETGPQGGDVRAVPRFHTLDDLDAISQLLLDSDPALAVGSDISRAQLARASEIAGAAAGSEREFEKPDSILGIRTGVDVAEVDAQLARIMEAAGRDHVAVHDIITARDGKAEPLFDIPGGTFVAPEANGHFVQDYERTSYDADKTIVNLLTYNWDESQGHDSGVRQMFDNLYENESYRTDSSPVGDSRARLDGEVATELALILGSESNYDMLSDAQYAGSQGFAELNPAIAASAASAIGPHLAALSGTPPEMVGLSGTDVIDGQDQMSRMFALFDTSEESGRIINEAAAEAVEINSRLYFENSTIDAYGHMVDLDPRGDAGVYAEYAGRILNAMNEGIYGYSLETGAIYELNSDYINDADDAFAQQQRKHEMVNTSIELVTSLLPGKYLSAISSAVWDVSSEAFEPDSPDTSELPESAHSLEGTASLMPKPGTNEATRMLVNVLPENHEIIRQLKEEGKYVDGKLIDPISSQEMAIIRNRIDTSLKDWDNDFYRRVDENSRARDWS